MHCEAHPNRLAERECIGCGRLLCVECAAFQTTEDGTSWCSSCAAAANRDDSSDLEPLLDGLEHPFELGWKLWRKSLPALAKQVALPAAVLAAFATPLLGGLSDPDTPASLWEALAVLAIAGAGVALLAAVVSSTFISGYAVDAPRLALTGFIPWVATLAVVGALTMAGYMLFVLPGIYVALRLFWADEFALIHGQNPWRAIQSSWRVTRGAVADVFGFQLKLGFVHLAVWFPAMIILIILFNVARASGVGSPIEEAFCIGAAAFFFTLAYGFSHSCEVVYFYGLRADHAAFLAEEREEPGDEAGAYQTPDLAGDQPTKQSANELPAPIAVGLSRPSSPLPACPSCGTHYDPADYRRDSVTVLCSACHAELSPDT